MKFSGKAIAFGGVVLLGLGFFLGSRTPSGDSEGYLRQTPLILNKVQALGDLHTARYTYQQVFDYSTSRTPEEWTNYVPGMSGLITASTRNTALMDTTGNVEAGVDLKKAKLEGKSTLVLPKPKIYTPHVSAQVHKSKRGVFWRDDNIALKAVRATEQTMMQAARKQGILEEAEKNAREQLVALVPETAKYAISFK